MSSSLSTHVRLHLMAECQRNLGLPQTQCHWHCSWQPTLPVTPIPCSPCPAALTTDNNRFTVSPFPPLVSHAQPQLTSLLTHHMNTGSQQVPRSTTHTIWHQEGEAHMGSEDSTASTDAFIKNRK